MQKAGIPKDSCLVLLLDIKSACCAADQSKHMRLHKVLNQSKHMCLHKVSVSLKLLRA